MRLVPTLPLLLVWTLLAGCGRSRELRGDELRGGAPSVEALGREVVQALAAGDTGALEALRTTEHEHNTVLWPRFPAARAADPALAWDNVQMRNAGARAEWIGAFRDRRVRYDRAECTGEVEEYGSFQILRGCSVTVTVDGQRSWTLRPFDRVVRMGAVHKVIRYVEVD
ncbi:MAG TPA: hypothetical protein VGB24_08805 [Longimicrobium sp.]|jgi:hypothetical protein|uniref:hypothetical protein n=1 Tax=Longimicrobium sp. TaxID=2029185 RepID=UPI002ED8E430